jgi:hypothetical protein
MSESRNPSEEEDPLSSEEAAEFELVRAWTGELSAGEFGVLMSDDAEESCKTFCFGSFV